MKIIPQVERWQLNYGVKLIGRAFKNTCFEMIAFFVFLGSGGDLGRKQLMSTYCPHSL